MALNNAGITWVLPNLAAKCKAVLPSILAASKFKLPFISSSSLIMAKLSFVAAACNGVSLSTQIAAGFALFSNSSFVATKSSLLIALYNGVACVASKASILASFANSNLSKFISFKSRARCSGGRLACFSSISSSKIAELLFKAARLIALFCAWLLCLALASRLNSNAAISPWLCKIAKSSGVLASLLLCSRLACLSNNQITAS